MSVCHINIIMNGKCGNVSHNSNKNHTAETSLGRKRSEGMLPIVSDMAILIYKPRSRSPEKGKLSKKDTAAEN